MSLIEVSPGIPEYQHNVICPYIGSALGATYKENTLFCSEIVFGYNYGILRYH